MFDRTKINFIKKWWLSIDKPVLYLILTLIFLGNIFVVLSSPVVASRIGIESNTFLIKNIVFSLIGIGIILTISFFNRKQIIILTPLCFFILIMLLILVFFLGTKNKGATRWIYLFGFSLQPSEIIKPFFVLLSSYILVYFKKDNNLNIIFSLFLYIILSTFLILQPDIGMLVLISVVFTVQLFLIIKKINFFIYSSILSTFFIFSFYFLFEHFRNRINTFFKSIFFDGEKSYQIEKSLSAFTNGGLLGKGPFEGSIKNHIPDAHTDFIFSVIAEEFGFVMCFFIISSFFYISIHFISKVIDSEDKYKYLATISLSFLFLFQSLINIGVTMNLLPTKGMTLPLISYGGSSMIGICTTLGFLLVLTKKEYTVLSNREVLEI